MVLIYRIRNSCTGKSLIGTTKKDLQAGFITWMQNCTRTKYSDYQISIDYKDYGKDTFSIELLSTCEDNGEALEIADSYVIQFHTLEPNGYNKNYLGVRRRTPHYYDKIDEARENKENKNELNETEKRQVVKADFRKKAELLNKYGITGIVKNGVPIIMAEKDTINAFRKLADMLERYGSQDIYEYVPSELNDDTNILNKELMSLVSKQAGNLSERYIANPARTIRCIKCGKFKDGEIDYFKHPDSDATYDGRIHICRECLKNYSKNLFAIYNNVVYVIMSICQISNIIFVKKCAEMAEKTWINKKEIPDNIFKLYMSELQYTWLNQEGAPSSMLQFRNSNFKGDIFGFAEHHPATPSVFLKDLNGNLIEKQSNESSDQQINLEQKWGKGFTSDEYQQLENEYNKLEKFLTKKTDLHFEALKKYVIYSFKEKNALAKGDLKEVKEWNSLADKAADNAQLKIKQLSADFGSEINSISQIVETVEEYDSIIPTLPKVKKLPYDDIDFIIWEVVNYERRLEGKPETSYEEVYSFIDTELTKKMIDAGLSKEEVAKEKDKRNSVFKDLSDNYKEPLWLVPDSTDDDSGDE